MPDAILYSFERSLFLEKEALQNLYLIASENQTFRQSILEMTTTLHKVSSHIVFSGVGKSGYVAKTIQSSFSSVGIPSFFLHPTEAVHGELGTLTKDNFVFLLSKSGDTSELKPILEYANRKSIQTGIITTSANASLSKMSDIVIEVPTFVESGLFRKSPTTTSLLFLALGNALATSISEFKNIKKEHFLESHPAGTIGKLLLRTV